MGADRRDDNAWPRALRVQPGHVVLATVALIAVAWGVFVAVDLLNVAGVGDRLWRPAWSHLFNDRVVEWAAWVVIAVSVVVYGFVAGRLHGTERSGAAAFFLVLGLGLALMLVEDAGDVRHVISRYVRDHVGHEVAGLPYRVASDFPYFTLLAAVPVYAVLRHGRHAWRAPSARPYLVAGVTLYALAGGGSAIRHLGDFYIAIGSRLDRWLLGGRFPPDRGQSEERGHFMLVDSLIEESVELLAAACLLAVALAFVADVRSGRAEPEVDPADPDRDAAATDDRVAAGRPASR
jgi:hypothetical protein